MKSKNRLKAISQFLVILLMLDAAFVALGLLNNWTMYPFICLYWVILTFKNLADYLAGAIKDVHDSGNH